MHDPNEALFLTVSFLFFFISITSSCNSYSPFQNNVCIITYHNKSDLIKGVLSLIFLLAEYYPFYKSNTSIYFLVTKFNTFESLNYLDVLWCCIL